MSMITRCPSCATMFKVVPDQLRISEGWVRCGHCGDVFDARLYLKDPLNREPSSSPGPAVSPAEQPDPAQPVPTGTAAAAASSRADATSNRPASATPDIDFADWGDAQPAARPDGAVAPAPIGAPAIVASSPAIASAGHEEAAADVSFVRQARQREFWRRGSVRLVMVLSAVLLFAVLFLQIALQERDRLASQWPGLRSGLNALCAPVGCVVRPWRRIDSVVIDASTFSRLRSDLYRLTVGVRNVSAFAVAAPAVELTLTDLQDRAVIRKVIDAGQLGWATELPAATEKSVSLTLAVDPPPGAVIGGYRVVVFYP